MCVCSKYSEQIPPLIGQDGVYDNTPGQRRPTGKKGSEVEEDIYGGVGGDGEGVYDTAGGGRKGMKYSQDGIYDNPLAGKGWSCVLCVIINRICRTSVLCVVEWV